MYEVNFDGIVGPTHNYSGLTYGNIASMAYKQTVSNPRAAALQGLAKMKAILDLGLYQAVLPPHKRPNFELLHRLGFKGSDENILTNAYREAPYILGACCSASSMWAANAATVAPSVDCADGRLHITPANMCTKLHRFAEAQTFEKIFGTIFKDPKSFVIHPPLPACEALSDEGAANHTRFCRSYGERGVHLFVYGRDNDTKALPGQYPARQSLYASKANARNHAIPYDQVIFAQQNPEAIDKGVFHNDVISVGNRTLFFFHESAFVNTPQVINEIERKVSKICNSQMCFICVTNQQVSLEEAVKSYLFNSQILSLPNGETVLIAPQECQELPSTNHLLKDLVEKKNFANVQFFNLRQSMQNGGGPACLRLRIVLTEKEIKLIKQSHPQIFFTPALYEQLVDCVQRHYRDKITPDDLQDPQLARECLIAHENIMRILKIPL